MKRRNWTERELRLVINLYHKLPFGKMHRSNQRVVQLSEIIGRTPSAIAMKLTNFASFDPELQARGISGLQNSGKLDRIVWDQFYENLQESIHATEEELSPFDLAYPLARETEVELSNYVGEEKEVLRKTRIGQTFFRNSLLSAYEETCCITGMKSRELMIASHIIAWADEPNQRLNPHNGLILNALHDKAFDLGLLTITPEYHVKLSAELKADEAACGTKLFVPYEGKPIRLPSKLIPNRDFLAEHGRVKFRAGN